MPNNHDVQNVQLLVKPLSSYSDVLSISHELAAQNQPFLRILQLARRAGAKYCLQWHDVGNAEWCAERELLYSYVHPPQPDYVIRLDFFSKNPLRKNRGRNKYIGYVALRPGPTQTVVECIMKPPTDTTNHYLLCKLNWETKYPVSDKEHVEVSAEAVCPFTQQDAVAGVCAHACLRTISLLLERNYTGCSAKTIKEMHERTSTMPLLEGSHLPSTGLAEFEIVAVIESMGAAPDLYFFEEGREQRQHLTLEQIIYPYVEAGIPVIIDIETEGESHSIAVVGHTFDKDSWWRQAEIEYFPTLAGGATWIPSYMWVPEFIVQDDNFGPYLSVCRMILGDVTRSILVPIPRTCHVFLAGYQAESLAANYLASKELYEYILQRTQTTNLWRALIKRVESYGNLVLRPMLVSKESFFQHVTTAGLSQQLSEIYQQADFSPLIWLVEVSVPELYSDYQKIGEVIINAQYPVQHLQTGHEPLLALRILDVVVVGTDFEHPSITTDYEPVSILTRPTFGK